MRKSSTPIDTIMPVRSAVLALFARLGVRPAAEDDAARARLLEGIAPEPARDRSPEERCLRSRAHAAYATVEGAGPAALDLALDVLADELHELDRKARHHAEALKAIRLYAPEPWVRRIAQKALAVPERAAPLPEFLISPDAEASRDG
jgi:hypothetical protein